MSPIRNGAHRKSGVDPNTGIPPRHGAALSIYQFRYRAGSLQLADGPVLDRFVETYLMEHALQGGYEFPLKQGYQAWCHSFDAWQRLVVLANALARQQGKGMEPQ